MIVMKLIGIGLWKTFKAQKVKKLLKSVFKPMARLHNLQRLVFGYILKLSIMSRYDFKKKLSKTVEFESENDPETQD
jgi:hypothetical protein